MIGIDEHEKYDTGLGLERLVFFSDAVFAIAITLLVLDIKVPDISNSENLAQAVLALQSHFLSYFISFMVLGIYWVGHHRNFRYIKRYDGGLLWFNLVFLLFVAFLPFPTSILGRYFTNHNSANDIFAVSFYAASVGITGLLNWLVWFYATYRNRLVAPDLDRRLVLFHRGRMLASVAIFFFSILIAQFNPFLAMLSWFLLLLARPIFRRIYKVHG